MARWKLIAGIIIGIIAFPIFIGGLAMTIALPLTEDNEGYYMSPWSRDADSVGIGFVFDVDIETGEPGSRFDISEFADFKFRARSEQLLFVGIAKAEEVDAYLASQNYWIMTDFNFGWGEEDDSSDYEKEWHPGSGPLAPMPSWDVSNQGTYFTLYWTPKEGSWTVVVINQDLSEGYDIQYKVGVKAPILRAIGLALLIFGTFLFITAGLLIYFDLKKHRAKPEPVWAKKEFTREPPPPKAVPGKIFCTNCGTQAEQADVFCTICGDRLDLAETRFRSQTPYEEPHPESNQLIIANFSTRFWAWLIDFVLIVAIVEGIRWALYLATDSQEWFPSGLDISDVFFRSFGPVGILFFAYWFICQWQWGQSLGQKALGLELVAQDTGEPLIDDPLKVALSVFGKAFLLPLDMIIGWILGGRWQQETGVDLKQRLFQRIAGVVVVRKRIKTPTRQANELFTSGS
ncbi:MAG: RDD family protein [Candidatus Hodarchaeota archaeon]